MYLRLVLSEIEGHPAGSFDFLHRSAKLLPALRPMRSGPRFCIFSVMWTARRAARPACRQGSAVSFPVRSPELAFVKGD
jgi:hypothetical protein